ncbi:MAG: bifunctional nuclease family protein [Dysgonamonadaceae bacterium]|nr:bifunctional nuclease family protein [Dysgonamonadaceae bacterium]
MNSHKIKLQLLGITFSQIQAGAYALVLTEKEGTRRIPIMIGTPEAQSIAIFLEGLNPPRPITHDLFISLTETLKIKIKEVSIYKHANGVFYSKLIFDDGSKEIQLDSRTSDAIAIAIRAGADIYITEKIMNKVAVEQEDDEEDFVAELEENLKKTDVSIDNMNLEELRNALEEAVTTENYEKASSIRDLIKKLEH